MKSHPMSRSSHNQLIPATLRHENIDGGYLSDIPTQGSTAPSDFSQELIESTKRLETQFKEKYNILRAAYEKRIKQLSEVVQETCSQLFTDEVLQEMMNNKVSAAFIPGHLQEIIEQQLHSAGEKHIQQLTENLSTVQQELADCKAENSVLTEKLHTAEKDLDRSLKAEAALAPLSGKLSQLEADYNQHLTRSEMEVMHLKASNEELTRKNKEFSNQIEMLKHELQEQKHQCNELNISVTEKSRDITILEQSFEQHARELALIENMDRQEQAFKSEMRQQIKLLTEERSTLHDEVQHLRSKLQYASEELQRCYAQEQSQLMEESMNHDRLSSIMKQVEQLMTQEANESNAAITAVHEKMKAFRQRLCAELQREKRLTAALQEELTNTKAMKEDEHRDLKQLREVEASLRKENSLRQAHEKELEAVIATQVEQLNIQKVQITDLAAKNKQLDEISRDYERMKKLEASLVEERFKLQTEREKEKEWKQFEERTMAQRMHYQNEIGQLQNQLRHSYTFGSTEVAHDSTSLVQEVSFKQTIDHWVQETSKLKLQHMNDMKKLEGKHLEDVHAVEQQLKIKYDDLIKALQGKLSEASRNIDQLKVLVESGHMKIHQKNQMINDLNMEMSKIRHQLQHATTESKIRRTNSSHRYEKVDDNTSDEEEYKHFGNADGVAMYQTHLPPKGRAVSKSNVSSARPSDNSVMSISTSESSIFSIHEQIHQEPPPPPPKLTHNQSLVDTNISSDAMKALSQALEDVRRAREDADEAKGSAAQASAELYKVKSELEIVSAKALAASDNHANEVALLREETKRLMLQNQQLQSTNADLEQVKSELNNKLEAAVGIKDELAVISKTLIETQKENIDLDAEKSSLQQQVKQLEEAVSTANSIAASASAAASAAAAAASTTPNEAERIEEAARRAAAAVAEADARERDYSEQIRQLRLQMEQHKQQQILLEEQLKFERESQSQLKEHSLLQSSSAATQLQQSLMHQSELTELSKSELLSEREQLRDARKREVKLHSALVQLEHLYKADCQRLRQDLASMKVIIQGIHTHTFMEIHHAISELEPKLKYFFEYFHRIQEKKLEKSKKSMAKVHAKEIDALEARFTKQFKTASEAHAKELEEMHTSVVSKAEEVIGSISDASMSKIGTLTKLNKSVSFAPDTTTDSVESDRVNRSNKLKPRRWSSAAESGVSETVGEEVSAAYESVLKGVLEAMTNEEVIDVPSAQQIVAIAEAHTEPSFAALASAKTIVAGRLDGFVTNLTERSIALSGTGINDTTYSLGINDTILASAKMSNSDLQEDVTS